MLACLFAWVWYLLAWFALISLATFVVPFFFNAFLLRDQDLKKKYGSEWAVVTGASSGIGKAIAEKCARQGINVVLVALPEQLLKDTHHELEERYPDVRFRMCPCNLSTDGYMTEIIAQTHDIPVSLLFNNAGFIVTGFFANVPIGKIMANYDCNATCVVKITHHFLGRMIDDNLRGAVVFTSSPAGLIPNPSAAIYGATKAFLTEFAASIAPEVRDYGIDVCVVHPSPVGSNFYDNAHKMDAIKFFMKTTTTPDRIATTMFSAVGRTVIRDQGYFPFVVKILLKVLDFNLFALIITLTSRFMGDFNKLKAERNKSK